MYVKKKLLTGSELYAATEIEFLETQVYLFDGIFKALLALQANYNI